MAAKETERTVTPERVREWERRAADPNLSPEALRDLAAQLSGTGFGSSEAFANLLANPNCPPDLLCDRIAVHPEAFLRNPMAPLLPLENPGFLHELSREDVLTLLARAKTPPIYVYLANGYPDPVVASAVRWHIHTRGEADPYGTSWQEEVFDFIGELPVYDDESLYEAIELGGIPRSIAVRLGRWPIPEPKLVRGEEAENEAPVEPRAELPRLSGGWVSLLTRPRPERLPYAAHPATPPEALRLLAHDLSREMAVALAGNPRTSSDVLAELYKWKGVDRSIRERIAAHPNTPPETLVHLAQSRYAYHETIRWALAANPNTPAETLRELSRSIFPAVRRLARRHPDAPRDLASAARKKVNEDTQAEKVDSPVQDQLAFLVAAQCRLPNARYHAAYRSLEGAQRLMAAVNPFTPPEMLARLAATDGHRLVRVAAQARMRDYSQTPLHPLFHDLPPENPRTPRPARAAQPEPASDRPDRERRKQKKKR